MDAERLKQIEEIYHAVLEVPESRREDIFRQLCGGDQSLRREIESLLAFEKTFDKFFDHPPESLAAEMFSGNSKETEIINRKIGHYIIKKILGKGGMGEVYLAIDSRLERPVALKILPQELTFNAARLKRFVLEAKAASALNHPNIITIYEIGKFEEINFIATEFIDGETVRDRLINGSMTPTEQLSAAVQTAEALAAAHEAGIIHRDIKPENIMIRRDGYVKILDFGLAKLTEKQNFEKDPEAQTRILALTMPGSVMGTASYMSPEQTRGLANIDARTDIWSLGVVIFEMFTGKTPFPGDSINDVIASILKTEAPPLSTFTRDCPPELERIVAKTLKKDREERYQVIRDLTLDLKALRKELEFSAELGRVTEVGEKLPTTEMAEIKQTEAASSRKFSMIGLLSIFLAIGLLLGVAWWFFGRNRQPSEITENASLKTVEIVSWSSSPGEFYSVGTFSPDGKMVAFTSTKTGTKNIWIKQTTTGDAIQITRDEFNNEKPIWSPNGEGLAFFSTRGNETGIWRIPYLGGTPKLIAAVEDGSSSLRSWSKKGLIYYESNHELFAVDVDSRQIKQITDFNAKAIAAKSISLSPDEQQIAYITVNDKLWSVWTLNLNEGAPKKLVSSATEIKNTVWHSDNQRIFYSAEVDGTFQIFETGISGNPPKQVTFAERDNFVVDVSDDGTKILYGSAKEESDIWGANLKDSREFIVASDINSELWTNVSPDGKSIAYQSVKNLSQGNKLFNGIILTKNINSQEPPKELVTDGFLPVWSPDGKSIAFMQVVGDKYQIDTIKAAGNEQKSLKAEGIVPINNTILPYNRTQTSDFSWSPDSNKIAFISDQSGQQNIWLGQADDSNVSQLTTNSDENLYLNCPLWSADGKFIAYTSRTSKRGAGGKSTFSVWVIDTETKISRLILQEDSFLRLIGWSSNPDELILVSIKGNSTVGLQPEVFLNRVSVKTGVKQQISVLKETYLYNIHLSPDKKNIAFVAHRQSLDNIWLMPVAGGEERKLTGNNDSRLYFSSLAWSPDNNSIFFGKQLRYSLLSMLSNFK